MLELCFIDSSRYSRIAQKSESAANPPRKAAATERHTHHIRHRDIHKSTHFSEASPKYMRVISLCSTSHSNSVNIIISQTGVCVCVCEQIPGRCRLTHASAAAALCAQRGLPEDHNVPELHVINIQDASTFAESQHVMKEGNKTLVNGPLSHSRRVLLHISAVHRVP